MDLRVLFLLFIIYSFIGWFMEIIIVSLKKQKLVSRGFLIGPCLPIYGFGALGIIIFLSRYQNDLVVLFVMSCVFGASLEYFTSYIMEKIFKTRWWDYSYMKYHINGRISLLATFCFGLLGIFVLKILNPMFMFILSNLSEITLTVLSMIIWTIFVVDVFISFNVISNIKRVDLSDAKDTTEEVNLIVKDTLKKRSILNKRLVYAFPNLKVKFYKNIENLKNKI